jgi:hypothetical protein
MPSPSLPTESLIGQSEPHFPGELPPWTLVADAMTDMDADALRHSVEKICRLDIFGPRSRAPGTGREAWSENVQSDSRDRLS